VWIDRVKWKLYPNLYTVLVGRPGLGKGAAINPMIALVKEAGVANILSDRITMEYALEKLSKGFPKTISTQIPGSPLQTIKIGTEATCLMVSTELSVFITASQFSITCLSDLWDCKEGVYQYGTRGKGEFPLNSPYVTLIGASAQDWLVKSVPADAVGGGFTRRVNFVFASKKDKKVAWPSKNGNLGISSLVEDLRSISQLKGEFTFSADARSLFESYYYSCEPNDFDDEATVVYKTSKWANASKLAMCISASRGDSLEINAADFQEAIDRTEEVTGDLKIVFRSVGESPLVSATARVLTFIETKGYASRAEILSINWKHISDMDLDRIIATLREAGIIEERYVGKRTLYYVTGTAQPVTP
jgi:hypothetical protein